MKQSCGALASILSHILRKHEPVQLSRMLSWRLILQDWPSPNMQHDVCEFGMYLLQRANIPACHGLWQAKDVAPPYTVMEANSTLAPILLEVPQNNSTLAPILLEVPQNECAIQDCIADWHVQESIRGLTQAPQILTLQLKRFHYLSNEVRKSRQTVALTSTVTLPCFLQGIHVSHVPYRIQSVIYHLGSAPDSGHYQSLLHLGDGRWVQTDDDRPGTLTAAADVEAAWQNSYLLIALKVPDFHT